MLRTKIKKIMQTIHADYIAVRLMIPFHHYSCDLTSEQGRTLLQKYSPKPIGSSVSANIVAEHSVDLQIIIPAYNAERYLLECVNSVLSQKTKYTFKVMLVDDGSTDRSGEIIGQYEKDERVVVIHQDNKGFSGARNRGIEQIFASYIMFLDSDDYLPEGAIESLMEAAVASNADITEGSVYSVMNEKCAVYNRYRKKNENYKGKLKGQPWGKVYRSVIFQETCFPEGFWFEDSINSLIIYPHVKRKAVIPEFVYSYRLNPDGISATAAKHNKVVDTYWVTEQLVEDYQIRNFDVNKGYMDALMEQFILNYRRTKNLDKEIKEAIFVLSSKLMKSISVRQNVSFKYEPLRKALEKSDYGAYEVCVNLYLL